MPKIDKSYIVSIAADRGSLDKFQNDVAAAFTKATEKGQISGISNQDKKTIQHDLATLFGVAEYQAEALREMVQGIVPKDAGKIQEMKENLHSTLEFATGLVQKMRDLGSASEWMKQGINLTGFTDMQNSIEVTAQDVSGLRSDLNELTKQFKEFREVATAPIKSGSIAQALTNEAQEIADSIANAQKKIDGLKKARAKVIKDIATSSYDIDSKVTGFSVDDTKAWSVEDIKEEYKEIRLAIETELEAIEALEEAHDNKTALAKNKKYQTAVTNLQKLLVGAKAIEQHGLFGDAFIGSTDQINATLRRVNSEITETLTKASKSIKDVVDEITGEGIELAINLPDANSEEFVSKVQNFVDDATKQFKDKPVEVSVKMVTSVDEDPLTEDAIKDGALQYKKMTDKQIEISDRVIADYKKKAAEAGVEVNDENLMGLYNPNVNKITRNILNAFNSIYGAMTSGQNLVASSAASWREQMAEEFTVVPKFDTKKTKEEIKKAISDLQTEFDSGDDDTSSFWISARPDARNFIKELQDAIKDQHVVVDVKAGKIDASGAPIDISDVKFKGDVPPADGGGASNPPSSGGKTSSSTPASQSAPDPVAPVVQENSDAISDSTRTQKVLNESIKQLNAQIAVNNGRIKMIRDMEGTGDPDEIIKSTTDTIKNLMETRSKLDERKRAVDEQLKTEQDPDKQRSLASERSDLERVLLNNWQHYLELSDKKKAAEDRKKNGASNDAEDKKSRAKKYEDENKALNKYKDKLEEVAKNNENPTKLVVDELKSFWTKVKNGIAKAEKENDVEALNRWKAKAAAMSVKGLDITQVSQDGKTVELVDDATATKIVEDVLRRNKSLGSDLLNDKTLKSAYVTRMGYYIPQVQKAHGIIPQTSEEAYRELNLNESLKSALKLNEYIKKARSLLANHDKDVDPADIQKFIDYFGHFPEMADSIEYAKQYLAEMHGIKGEPWQNKDQKTYQEQIADILDGLDKDSKETLFNALSQSKSANDMTIKDLDTLRSNKGTYNILRNAFAEDNSALSQLATDNPQLNNILDILKRSALLNNTRVASRVFESDRKDGSPNSLLSALHGMQRNNGTIHVTVIGRDNQEKVLELNGGRNATDADKRFTYTPKSMERFAKNSGKEKEINELVDAMFDPAILAKERLEAEVLTMERNLNSLKLGHPHADAFIGTDLEENFRKLRSAAVLSSNLQYYLDNDHEVEDIRLFDAFPELQEESHLKRQVNIFKNGGIPKYFEDAISELTGAERDNAIKTERERKESEYARVKDRNHQKAIATLAQSEAALKEFREKHKNAIDELIVAQQTELEIKKQELEVARAAAVQAEQKVDAASKALFTDGFRLSANAEAATPIWAQEEQFDKTVLGQYQKKEKQLRRSIDVHKAGGTSYLVKNAMEWLHVSEEAARKHVVRMLESELEELLANPPSQEDIIYSMLVREDDARRSDARSRKQSSQSNKQGRAAERITSGDDVRTYNREKEVQRYAIERYDSHLDSLISRIDFARQNGLMNTDELDQLVIDFQKNLDVYAYYRELVEDERIAKGDDNVDPKLQAAYKTAFKDMDAMRTALLDKFFGTEGWNVSRVLENLFSEYDGELAQAEREIRDRAAKKNLSIDDEVSKIREREASMQRAADQYAQDLLQEYVFGPQFQVEKAQREHANEIAGINKNAQIEKDALRRRVQDGTYWADQIRSVENERSKDRTLNEIASKKSKISGIDKGMRLIDMLQSSNALYYSNAEIAELTASIKKMESDQQQSTDKYKDAVKRLAEIRGNFTSAVDAMIAQEMDANIDRAGLIELREKLTKEGKQGTSKFRVVDDRINGRTQTYGNAALDGIQKELREEYIIPGYKEYLKYIQSQFGGKIHSLNADLERGVLNKSKNDLVTSLENSDTVIAEINAGYDARVFAIKQLAEGDKVIHEQVAAITAEWKAETDPIEQQMLEVRTQEGVTSDAYKELVEKRNQINVKYNKSIREAQEKWIAEQSSAIDASAQEALDAVVKTDVDKDAILARFNKMASDKLGVDIDARTEEEIREVISELKKLAYDEAARMTLDAINNIDRSKGMSQEDVEKEITAKRAETESKKAAALALMKTKSDAEAMAMHHTNAVETLDEASQQSKKHADALRKANEEDQKRYAISDDMLKTARENAVLSGEMAEVREKEKKAVEQQNAAGSTAKQPQTPGGGSSGSGHFGAIDTSNLARESTLRGIYELLNGGAPTGGWGDENGTKAQTHDNRDGSGLGARFSRVGDFVRDGNFAQSVKMLMDGASDHLHEVMTLVGDGRILSSGSSGLSGAITEEVVNDVINKESRKIDFALHNHPDGDYTPSMGDFIGALAVAFDEKQKEVKGSGSYNENGVSLIDFSDIPSKDVAWNILKQALVDWASMLKSNGITMRNGDDGEQLLFDQDLYGGKTDEELDELAHDAYQKLYKHISDSFAEAGYDDVFKSFTYDEIAKLAQPEVNAVAAQAATEQVAEAIIENAGEAARQAVDSADVKPAWKQINDIVDADGVDGTDREIAKQIKQYSFRDVAMANVFRQRQGYIDEINGQNVNQPRIDRPARFKTMDSANTDHHKMIQAMADVERDIAKAYQQLNPEKYEEISEALRNYYKIHDAIVNKGIGTVTEEEFAQREAAALRVAELAGLNNLSKPRDMMVDLYKHVENGSATMLSRNEDGSYQQVYDAIENYIIGFFSSFNLDHIAKFEDVARLVESGNFVAPVQEAAAQVADTVVEAGAQAAAESAKLINLPEGPVDDTTAKKLGQKINEVRSKKDGGYALSQSMFNLSSLGVTSDKYTFDPSHANTLATAYDQLMNGMSGTIADQLSDGAKAYINLLRIKLEDIAKENGLDYTEIKKAIDAKKADAKNIAGTSLTQDSYNKAIEDIKKHKDETGADRAVAGLQKVYSVLSNGKDVLSDADIKKLGSGYFRLVETVGHEINDKFDEDTKKILADAMSAAFNALKNAGAYVYGSMELDGVTVSDKNQHLINKKGAGPNGATGRKFGNLIEPAIEVARINENGEEEVIVLQKAVGQLQKINDKKKENNKLTTEGTAKENQAAEATKKHADAANKVVEAYKTKLTKESIDAARGVIDQQTRTKKDGTVEKQSGIRRAKGGLKNVFGVLSTDTSKLDGESLDTLKTGYKQLVETVGTALYNGLDKQYQDLIVTARDEALEVLKRYGVDANNIDVGDSTGGKSGGGNKSGVKSGGKSGGSGGGNNGGSGNGSGGGNNPPYNDNKKGGLAALAKESTLQDIRDILSKGIKVTKDGKIAGDSEKNSSKSKSGKQTTNLTIQDAETALQAEIAKKYPNIIKNSSSVRETMMGYSMDFTRPKDMKAVLEAQKEIAELTEKINEYNKTGEYNIDEYNKAQNKLIETRARYNGLLKETEQITMTVSRTDASKFYESSSFKNLDFGIKAANKELETVEDTMDRIHKSRAFSVDKDGNFVSANSKVEKYISSLKELQDFKGGLTAEGLFKPENQQRLEELALSTQNARKEMTLYLDAVARYNSGEHFKMYDADLGSNESIKSHLKDMLSAGNQNIEKFGDLQKITNKYGETVAYQLGYSLRVGKHEVQEMTASINPLTKEIVVQEGALKTVTTGWEKFWAGLKSKAASIVQYIASITSIQDIIRYAREGVQYVKEIDTALTELKKVTDETDEAYSRFLKDMAKTGGVIGATVTDLTTMAAEWARLNI